jgi:Tol biopolymer transport system component/DNA-binding winged helix-turn-helix (wHTH) protein
MIFRFDRYILNSGTRTLSCRDAIVTLTPKVFQTLLVLVENHHRVMSKAELFEQLWPQQVVEEANLTQNISILRKALEEATYGKRYIATFHGHGYRFVEPVVIGETTPAALAIPDSSEWSDPPPDSGLLQSVPAPLADSSPSSDRRTISTLRGADLGRSILISVCVLLSVAVMTLLYARGRRSRQPVGAQAFEITALTRMEGTQYQPSWSADGKELAFVDSTPDDKSSSIYIQLAGDVQPREVISGSGSYSSPVWSPDGKSLALIHFSQNSAEILILSLPKMVSRRLTTLFPHRYGLDYRHLDWSPDGNFLVVDDKVNETDPLSLYLVPVSDGRKLRLTYPDMDIIGDVAPRFSPDGSGVAFIRLKYQYQDGVFVVPVTGGEARQLTDQAHLLGDVDWQTKDTVIYNGRLDDQFRFWRRDLRVAQASPAIALTMGTDLPSQFSIARRTGQLAFSAYSPDLNIWSLDLTKVSSPATAWNPVIRTPGQDIEPSLSPNGAWMAFRSDKEGHMQLWVSRRDGTEATSIDTHSVVPSVYCWTRDSKALIFSSNLEPGLFEATVSGASALRRLTNLPLSHPACSVDGKSVFAIDNNFVYRLSILNGAAKKITDDGGAPIFQSTDGRYIYFAHGRMDSTISRLDLETGSQAVVVDSLAPGYSESWALTSRGILFFRMSAKGAEITFHDFATNGEKSIAQFSGNLPPVGLSQFSISPDEKILYVVRADPVSANIESANIDQHIERAN